MDSCVLLLLVSAIAITPSVPSGAEFLMHVWGKDFRATDTTTQMGTNCSSPFIDTASFEVVSVVNVAR